MSFATLDIRDLPEFKFWRDAPDWAKWHSFDSDGQGYYFSAKPRAGGFQWRVTNTITDRYSPSKFTLLQKGKWKQSMRFVP